MLSTSSVLYTIFWTWLLFTVSGGLFNTMGRPAAGWRYFQLSFFSLLYGLVLVPTVWQVPVQQAVPPLVILCGLTVLTIGFTGVK
jgi:hypothetical protein